jgi:succinyl-diaminopimelate desuccinylase
MNAVEQALAYLDKSEAGIIELEKLLTAIPALAPESGGDGEWKKALALEAWLKKRGIVDIERHDAPDERVSDKKRPNLVATIKGRKPGKRLWIMAHTDVVPEGDRSLWEQRALRGAGQGRQDIRPRRRGQPAGPRVVGIRRAVPPGQRAYARARREAALRGRRGIRLGIRHTMAAGQSYALSGRRPHHHTRRRQARRLGDRDRREEYLLAQGHDAKGKQCHASRPDDGANAFLANCELALALNRMEAEVFHGQEPYLRPAALHHHAHEERRQRAQHQYRAGRRRILRGYARPAPVLGKDGCSRKAASAWTRWRRSTACA